MLVAEGTVGTVSFYFNFMMHVATRGNPVPNLVVKLD